MMLRVGFDMDGVLADFGTAFRNIECELFGTASSDPKSTANATANEEKEVSAARVKNLERRRRAVWERIRSTPDFWTTLDPLEPGAVRQLHGHMLRRRWEVVFITKRPSTAGETVQRQTQRWLVQHGFDMPSVVVIEGSRGAAINSLRLTHHVDDSTENCVDVKTDSSAMPILIVDRPENPTARQARKLGMSVAASIVECLELLDQAAGETRQSSVVSRLAALVNWTTDQRTTP